MIAFRVYVREGCPSCESALQWFREHYSSLPVEFVAIGNDPVLTAGVKAWGEEVPLVVSFASNKIIKGFRPEEYRKHVAVFLERNSPSAFTLVEPEGVDIQPPTPVDAEVRPTQGVQ